MGHSEECHIHYQYSMVVKGFKTLFNFVYLTMSKDYYFVFPENHVPP